MTSTRTQYRTVPYREKRKDRRVLFPPLTVVIANTAFDTANWSFGGFLIEACNLEYGYGDTVSGTIGWADRSFPFAGRVSRYGGEARELAVAFCDISDTALLYLDARLSQYLNEQKRG